MPSKHQYAKMTPAQKQHARNSRQRWVKAQGPVWKAERTVRYNHGYTLEQKQRLLAEQNYRCANPACDFTTPTPSPTLKEWCFDHDHACCPIYQSCEKCRRG